MRYMGRSQYSGTQASGFNRSFAVIETKESYEELIRDVPTVKERLNFRSGLQRFEARYGSNWKERFSFAERI